MSEESPVFKTDDLAAVLRRLKDGEFNDDKPLNNVLDGVKRLAAMNYGPFITNVSGDIDGYPENIFICYHYGVNYGGVYKLVHHGRTGQ